MIQLSSPHGGEIDCKTSGRLKLRIFFFTDLYDTLCPSEYSLDTRALVDIKYLYREYFCFPCRYDTALVREENLLSESMDP